MEVEGIDEERRGGEIIEWTLDHHKLFVDTWMQLGTDFIVDTPDNRGITILIQHLNTNPLMKAVPPSALFGHVMSFGVLQHKTHDRSSSSLSSSFSRHPSLMEEFAGRLNSGHKKEGFSWTIEDHSRFVEAVGHVGGLDDARPHDIMRLMVDKEKSRQGLTEHMVTTHLWRLRDLQKRTQNDIFSSLEEENVVWTMEHHTLFVETWLGLGDSGISNGLIELIKSSAAMKRVPRNALVFHMMRLQCLQDKTRALLSSWRPAWGQGKNYMILVQFERLGIHNEEGLLLSSWTLEHHKKFMEAVIQLGGLEKANEAGILRLMEEEHRQGLTQQVVSTHLSGLRELQKMTQDKINGWEDYSRRNSLMVIRRKRQLRQLLSTACPYGRH